MKRFLPFIALVVIAVAGCRTAQPSATASVEEDKGFTVKVDGTPGLKFTGKLVVNGVSQKVSGTVPAIYPVTAHSLVCSFKKQEADGQISLAVDESGKKLGGSTTACKYGGVRAEFVRANSFHTDIFTTLN
jgi:hypothetical protein